MKQSEAYTTALNGIEAAVLDHQDRSLLSLFALGDAVLAAQHALGAQYPVQVLSRIENDLSKRGKIEPPDATTLSVACRAAAKFDAPMRAKLVSLHVSRKDMLVLVYDRHREKEGKYWLDMILKKRIDPPYNLYRRIYDRTGKPGTRRVKSKPGTAAGQKPEDESDRLLPVDIHLTGAEDDYQRQCALENLLKHCDDKGMAIVPLCSDACARIRRLRAGG